MLKCCAGHIFIGFNTQMATACHHGTLSLQVHTHPIPIPFLSFSSIHLASYLRPPTSFFSLSISHLLVL